MCLVFCALRAPPLFNERPCPCELACTSVSGRKTHNVREPSRLISPRGNRATLRWRPRGHALLCANVVYYSLI